jgi:DNA-directed RNA polymerase specialized sigma24 family protein
MADPQQRQELAKDPRSWVMGQWQTINQLAGRRFGRESLAEEAALYVLDQLAAEDWRRLRGYRGQASLPGYFRAVVYRLLEDFARRRFGRRQVPGWLARLGGAWLTLFRLLCWERFSFPEAIALAATRRPRVEQKRLERMAEHILAEVVHCGSHQEEISVDSEEMEAMAATGACPNEQAEKRQREDMLQALFVELVGAADEKTKTDFRLAADALSGLQLSGEERLLLQLCYRDGHSVTTAGTMLGLNRFQAHGRLRRVLARIRGVLSESGYGEELQRFLHNEPTR